jgi:electron transport complex protein RnfA
MFLMQEFFIILTSNLLFSKVLGTDILMFAKKSKRSLNVLSLYVAVFSIICSVITAFTDNIFADYLIPLVDTIIVLVLYFLGLGLSKIFGRKAFENYKKYMHFAAMNTAVFGLLFMNKETVGISSHAAFALETSIGFFLGAWMLSTVYDYLAGKNIPKCFRGYPAMILYIGIVSMALYSL